jgi:hypothetical protein
MSSPAHINLIAEEASDEVAKAADAAAPKLTKKQAAVKASRAKKTVKVGGGV